MYSARMSEQRCHVLVHELMVDKASKEVACVSWLIHVQLQIRCRETLSLGSLAED